MPYDVEQTETPQVDASEAGQDTSIEVFWRKNSDRLLRRAYGFANGRSDLAEELVSTSMLKLIAYMRNAPRAIDNLESLAFVTLRHVAFDRWRKKRRETEGLTDMARDKAEDAQALKLADDILHARQIYNRISEHLETQDEDTQFLFYQRFILELPYADISAQLGISEALARKRVQSLRRRLKTVIESESQSRALTNTTPKRLTSKSKTLQSG